MNKAEREARDDYRDELYEAYHGNFCSLAEFETCGDHPFFDSYLKMMRENRELCEIATEFIIKYADVRAELHLLKGKLND